VSALLGGLNLSLSGLFALAVSAVLFSVVLWLLTKRRMKRIRLPTLRVLAFDTRKLPKFVLVRPPLIPFLCFLLCALLFVLFSLGPYLINREMRNVGRAKSLLVIDLSPSVSSVISMADYRLVLEQKYQEIFATSDVYLLGSQQKTPRRIADAADFRAQLAAFDFHKAGLRLATLMRSLGSEADAFDRFYFFSDGDRHTWSGFNWRYLTRTAKVEMHQLAKFGANTRNLYVRSLDRPRAFGATERDVLEVEVARSGDLGAEGYQGNLDLTLNGDTVQSLPFKMEEGQQKTVVTIPFAFRQEQQEAGTYDLLIREPDSLAMDNALRIPQIKTYGTARITGGMQGERFLYDPTYDLQMALEVLGFELTRSDTWRESAAQTTIHLVMTDPLQDPELYCPKSDSVGKASTAVHWFIPTQAEGSFVNICRCLHSLQKGTESQDTNYCEEATSPVQWSAVLKAMGANRLGGSLADERSTLVWTFPADRNNLSVPISVFLQPLRSHPFGVFSAADLPVLIKDLIELEKIPRASLMEEFQRLGREDTFMADAEIDDSSPNEGSVNEDSVNEDSVNEDSINVPVAESQLLYLEADALPPQASGEFASAGSFRAEQQERIVTPIVFWLLLSAMLLMIFESGYYFWQRFTRMAVLFLVLAAFTPFQLFAQVQLHVVGSESNDSNIRFLANEIENRTSIEMVEQVSRFDPLAARVEWKFPWLWAQQSALTRALSVNAQTKNSFQLWLRRGGFLIIDGYENIEELKGTTSFNDLVVQEGEGWGPIPPDHEIMRSFYLLDTLPLCAARVWYGYNFDGRLAILASPLSILDPAKNVDKSCLAAQDQELMVRSFVNIVMVGLATDYKKDQIHLPEILKRLRQ
jgi:hypothetical protein